MKSLKHLRVAQSFIVTKNTGGSDVAAAVSNFVYCYRLRLSGHIHSTLGFETIFTEALHRSSTVAFMAPTALCYNIDTASEVANTVREGKKAGALKCVCFPNFL